MTAHRTAAIVIASTRASAGLYEDRCGPLIRDWLVDNGYPVQAVLVVPDGDAVGGAISQSLSTSPSVLITSGGTGISPTDATPEQTEPFLNKSLPGIMEAIRRAGALSTPMAALSRGHAGIAGSTFVINLPGSPGGVRDGLSVLEPLLNHICSQLEGINDH